MPRNETLDELEAALEAQEREGGVMSAKCPHCAKEFAREKLFKHMWLTHREAMLAERRSRGDCKNTEAANMVRGFGGTAGFPGPVGKLDNADSLGETVGLRTSPSDGQTPEDAAEQQAMPAYPSKHPFMPEMPKPPIEDRLRTKLDLLDQKVREMKLQQQQTPSADAVIALQSTTIAARRFSFKMALLEFGDNILSLATLRITRG